MITKRQMLELIQNRLSGGDTPNDYRRLYPLPVISRVLNFAFADLVTRRPDLAIDMALPYTFDVESNTSGYYVTLDPQPIAGSMAIFNVEDEGQNFYNVQSKQMAKEIRIMRGSNKDAAIYDTNRLLFNKQPQGDVTVIMVPNVYQMNDNDVLIANSDADGRGEMALFGLCLQVLQTREFQDDLNNNSIDAQYGRG
jgi:hypothetical protein